MDSSGAVGLDESPHDPTPSPLPQPRSRSLFFRSSEEDSLPLGESLSTAATEGAPAADGDGSASGPGWTSEQSDQWSDDDPDSSTASPAGDKPLQLLSKRQMKDTAEAAVKISTGMVHTVAAKTEAQQAVGLYLADDEDAKAIGHPLAEIAYRRGDVVGGKLSPDANNLLQSVFGIVGYFTKQVQKVGVIRQIEGAQPGGDVQTFPTEAAS
jgi:hypothetical protein